MLANPTYHRPRLYSDIELYSALFSYLADNFIFRKLEIDRWLGDERIIYKSRDRYLTDILDSGKIAEELWQNGEFEDWADYTPITVKNICSEFMFRNSLTVGKSRKKLIKDIIKAEIEMGSLTLTVKFKPQLKELIDRGRKKVTGIKPLSYASNKRVKVELNEGDFCYFCWNTKTPYVANPAYVYRKFSDSFLIIFFSNQYKGTETSKLEINMGRFINAPADELGLTPEQAVLQRFC